MSSARIIVTISADGDTETKVEGMAGDGCKGLTKDIEEAIGVVRSTYCTVDALEKPQITKINQK